MPVIQQVEIQREGVDEEVWKYVGVHNKKQKTGGVTKYGIWYDHSSVFLESNMLWEIVSKWYYSALFETVLCIVASKNVAG